MYALSTCCCRPSARRPTQRPAAARCPRTGAIPPNISSRVRRPPERIRAGRRMRRRHSGSSTRRRPHRPRLLRRRRHQRRRILGIDQPRLPSHAPVSFWSRTTATRFRFPSEHQTPGGSHLEAGGRISPDCSRLEVDGTDFIASYRAMRSRRGVLPRRPRTRAGARPLHPPLFALASDDESTTRRSRTRGGSRARSAGSRSRASFSTKDILSAQELDRIAREITREIHEVAKRALEAAPPEPERLLLHLYSEDGRSDFRRVRHSRPARGRAANHGRPDQRHA